MDYEWDTAKAQANFKKHGVDFADAVIALEDEFAITIPDPHSEAEERFVSLGADPLGRILVTVFTYRAERIRIISSRRATPKERRIYEEEGL
jgi:hypothetical protein